MTLAESPRSVRTDARPTLRHFLAPLAVALVLTMLNSIKPLHIDDAAYYQYAAHFAKHPFDPYGFEVYWGPTLQPAHRILAPPLLPYWWAVGIMLFGVQPFLWKLWLFPFCLVFALSLHTLFRRFASGLETPMLWMTALSPTFLPSLNLMLDIPALSLGLFALALFLGAADRRSWALSALAGVFAGLAMLTKYTAFTTLPVVALYALVFGKAFLGLVAGVVAVLLFAAWEYFVLLTYGTFHFVHHFQALHMSFVHARVPRLTLPLVGILGGLALAPTLCALTALGASTRVILAGAAVGMIGYILLAFVPSHYTTFMTDPATAKARLTLNNLVVGFLGLGFWGSLVAMVRQHRGLFRERSGQWGLVRVRSDAWFLILWLGIEVLGYFALSPFPAVRRVMGVVVAATVLIGHVASVTCRSGARRRLIHGVAVGGVVLGLGYYAVDLVEATAERRVVEEAVSYVRSRDAHGTIWYVGFWGFQFHANRVGMKPAFPNLTRLTRGDWLVVPEGGIAFQRVHIDDRRLELLEQLSISDRIPFSTKPAFYAGRSPIVHHEGPRVSLRVYRVNQDSVFDSSY